MFCLFLYTGLWIQSPNEIPQSLGYLGIHQQKKEERKYWQMSMNSAYGMNAFFYLGNL